MGRSLREHNEELQRELEERTQTETALLAAKERTETILNSITDIYVSFDREWRFTDMNARAEQTLGKERKDVLGRTVFEVFPRVNDREYRSRYQEVMTRKTPVHLEAILIAGRWLEAHAYPSDEGVAVYFRDITERRQAEDALRKSAALLMSVNRELESFSYSVSHNLQAPLRAIKGFCQMILKDNEEGFDDKTRRRIDVIRENAENMQLLIEKLLVLSRVSRQPLSFGTIDMNTLLKSVWNECETAYPGKPLALKADSLPPAYGDLTLIQQVLSNIFLNAVKYSQRRNPVEIIVGSYPENEGTVYYVKDNGVGFDMKYSDKLFGVFERLHTTAEFEGTGIGLSVAQRIIHRHGGRIWAEGAVDKGACFYFLLPGKKKKEAPAGGALIGS